MSSAMLRTSVLRATRTFSTTPLARKSASEVAKDTIKAADRTVSDAAVKGIEKGEKVAEKSKDAFGVGAKKAEANAAEAKYKAKETAEDVKSKI
ncbi:MAG: hypothetical protein M1825_005282 [Sarcosagium campestre]|nr:MAG: hypothetical protein M1825_005282 [Sarcosagium campestre]